MSEAEERRLSRALNVDRASLRPMTFAGCSALDVDEDEILRQDGDPERFKERKLMEHKPVKRLE